MNVWPLPRITFRGLSSIQETRPVALLTQPATWTTLSGLVDLPVVIQAEPDRNDHHLFDYLATRLPSTVEVVYAVGEGIVLDAGKIVAHYNKIPLVIIPDTLDGDGPYTAQASANDGHNIVEVETGPATEVVVDLDLISRAAPEHRAAGLTDVLAIVTALMDWNYASTKNQLTHETRLQPWALGTAAGLVGQALKSAAGMGKGDADSLHTLVDLICVGVSLDNTLGHRRASRGVEHIFAHAITDTNKDLVNYFPECVGAGILLASALHSKDVAGLRTAMEAAGVNLAHVPTDAIRATFNTLPDYARATNAPFTILNDLQSDSNELLQAMGKSTLFPATAPTA